MANTTYQLAPWADYIYAMDSKWWINHEKKLGDFHGEKFAQCRRIGLKTMRLPEFNAFGNSGAAAVSVAMMKGARRIYLLGYDCQRTNGKAHWHGDHPKGMGNAWSVTHWPRHFNALSLAAKKATVEIVNCSRSTALRCFPVVPLESIL